MRLLIVGVCLAGAGLGACGGGANEHSADSVSTANTMDVGGLRVSIATSPDPPTSGALTLDVKVATLDGKPVDDADVSAVLSMPPMPSMGMPEMHTSVKLEPAGEGRYRGNGNLVMSGTWNVALDVNRGGQALGTWKFAIQAK